MSSSRPDLLVAVVPRHRRACRRHDPAPAPGQPTGLELALNVREAASEALGSWDAFEAGAVDLLGRVGRALDARIALLWTRERNGELHVRQSWPAADEGPAGDDLAADPRVAPALALVRTAWAAGEPVMRDPTTTARGHGIVAIPCLRGDEPVAVLSFHELGRRVEGAPLTRALRAIGLDVARQLARHRRELGAGCLSPRELEVLQLAADGLTGPAIATALFISPATVKAHFQNIYEKLGAADRASAVAQAFREGLIS